MSRRRYLVVLVSLLMLLLLPLEAFAATKKVTLYVDSATKSTATLKASGLKASKATWKSSKKSVATVVKGKVTAKKTGTTKVTAKQGKKSFTFTVTVKKVSISKKAVSLAVGDTLKLSLTGDKIKAAKSSKATVATVARTGKVVAKKVGTTTVTLTSKKGKKYTCKVTVKAPSNDPTVTGAEINSVILAYEFHDNGTLLALKVKDGCEDFATWSKSFKPKVGAGVTYKLVDEGTGGYAGYTMSMATMTVTAGPNTREYKVEAYPASSVDIFGVFQK